MASTASTLSWNSSSWFQNHLSPKTVNPITTTKPSQRCPPFQILAQKKVKKVRKIILKEDVVDVGKKGDLMDVRAGFYRNFLHPTGKAQRVTPLLIKEMKLEKEKIEAEKQRVKDEAQQLARIFETVGAFKVKRKSGKGKQIFGSVTAQDLVDIIKAQLQSYPDQHIAHITPLVPPSILL
ncbi:hypothetical protein LguiA_012334 [Lonicera macranthoides]